MKQEGHCGDTSILTKQLKYNAGNCFTHLKKTVKSPFFLKVSVSLLFHASTKLQLTTSGTC